MPQLRLHTTTYCVMTAKPGVLCRALRKLKLGIATRTTWRQPGLQALQASSTGVAMPGSGCTGLGRDVLDVLG